MIETTINSKDLSRLLNKLDSDVRNQVIMDSLYQSSLYIAEWVKEKRLSGPRPKYLDRVSFRLINSITATPTKKVGNTFTTTIGTNVVYARAHEYGYPPRNLPARPFLRPAFKDNENMQSIITDLTRNIERQLES